MKTFVQICLLTGIWFFSFAGIGKAQTYNFTTIAGLAGVGGSADGTNSDARFYFPSGLTVDTAGVLYICDLLNHTIRKIAPKGTNWVVTTIAGTPGVHGWADGTNSDARFDHPTGVVADPSGALVVADKYNDVIRRLTPIGTNWVVTTVAGLPDVTGGGNGTNTDARFWGPSGLAQDKSNRLYVVDSSNHTIRGIVSEDTNWVVSTLAGTALSFGFTDGAGGLAQFDYPYSIGLNNDGRLFVADYGNQAIRMIVPTNNDWLTTTIANYYGTMGTNDGPADLARFNFPIGVSVDGETNLFVTDQSNHTIRKIAPSGTGWVVSTIGGAPLQRGSSDGTGSNARFNKPWGIAVDATGSLFIADYVNQTIRKGTPLLAPVPMLQISASPGQVVLSWPSASSNYLLETSGTLSSVAVWAPLTNGISISGSNFFLTNSLGGAAAFYRLHRQ
jgi:hypothetical protein